MVIPGIFGASVNQINVLFDRIFALWLGGYAITSLYYSERVIYLPIGIFAVALSTACLPEFSRAMAQGETAKMGSSLWYSMRHVLYLTLPCVLVLLTLPLELINLLFARGAFDEESAKFTVSAMLFYAPGIPAFAAAKILRAGFFSSKDTKTPVKIGITCLILNLFLNIILIFPLKHCGLALATTISSYANVVLLSIALFRIVDLSSIRPRDFFLTFGRITCGLLGAGLVICFLKGRVSFFTGASIWSMGNDLFFPASIGILTYVFISVVLGSKEPGELLAVFSGKIGKKKK